ncbi:hypothetical protein COW36_16065 [bacterium (Candidatus Blackallbacteria) CG17_big_fil_post_rev_8_21_14_2_50_48_46]|uniref:Uncharacterized protein n=1 Tax=bacterium (Candidatus Blackallbacteria) CG17_big_fil_post_rev_8_21_14_2_50_48_46 TaxID=2014261 RepID=A0A2M7G1U6_9BACT|nr:MAG: hypothetical protein COW64_08600 [bacterium (Candidatus Blackallbacteria) CG18_big_fil_WC_8_21_14_2_50_49_26]PIW15718.1 MAG: hypothetical protein COW36_16065 [bacterium (Candidatus Blackallbacteria) CG17_big_fil_post_rev_8_21_14_2_50_48_46]PIW49220.1 MAG: hypothetical protein COW20_06575 [bacterium (Candidatus Blackallbacteria) CG13_big_fil_rev_8_21_14_2_50_49_14]
MGVQFNRENVQGLWERKAGRSGAGTGPLPGLDKALSDNKLTREEYQSLKQEYLKENPKGDFDSFLADALDGKLDQKTSENLKQAVQRLGANQDSSVSIAFNLNAAQDGYSNVAAMTFEKPAAEIFSFVEQADGDKNGRIDLNERAGLAQALSKSQSDPTTRTLLEAQLKDSMNTLSYDSESKSITVWLGGDAPRLNTRYKDVRLDLDLSLKDINGITDDAQGDLSGTAGGKLDFDWNGPLVDSLKRGLVESSSGWAQANARYVPAGDKEGYGPGYVIQVETPKADLPLLGEVGLATRPIVLRADNQGRLYVASPGFGEGTRLWAAEKALNKYALPELEKMGIHMSVSREKGKLYLTPGQIQLSNLPLSTQGGAQGALNLGLNGQNTRFNVSPEGLQARFSQIPVQGSTHAQGPQASADAQADTLQGKFQMGLNTDIAGHLDTQVVIQDATAQVHLDKDEIAAIPALPGQARSLLGDSAEGTLQLRGDYRTHTQDHSGSISGKIDLRSRNSANGDQTAVFTHFQTQGDTRQQNKASLSVAGTDLSYTHLGNTARMQAETGAVRYEEGKPLRVQLFNAEGQAQVTQDTLKYFQKVLNQGGDRAQQLESAMKAAGISTALLDRLSKGDSAQLREMLKMDDFVEQLKSVSMRLKAQNWSLDLNGQGYRAEGQNIRLKTQSAGLEKGKTGSELKLESSAQSMQVDSSNWRDLSVQAQNLELNASARQNSAAGSLSTDLKAQAQDLNLAAAYTEITPESLAALQNRLKAGSPLLEEALSEVGGLSPEQLESLRNADPATLTTLATDPEIQGAIEQVGLNRLFSAEFVQTHASLSASAQTASQSSLRVEASTHGLSAETSSDHPTHLEAAQSQLSADYQDQRGNSAQMQAQLNQTQLRILPDGKFQAQSADAQIQSQIQTQVDELRRVMGVVGGEKLQALLQTGDRPQTQAVLEQAGLSKAQASSANELLWHPKFQELLKTSEFMQGLNQAETLALNLSGQGKLEANQDSAHLNQAELHAQGQVKSSKGQTLLKGQVDIQAGSVEQSAGQTTIQTQTATGQLQAYRNDGSEFADLSARAENLKATLDDQGQRLETGKLEAQGQAHTHLDAAKVAEVRKILGDFKNNLQERLQALGINRDQFEQFVQAFGQKQLSQMFSSANPEQLASLSRDLGVSADQVERMVGLLNDQTFSKLVENIYQFTQVLENGEATLSVQASSTGSQWERNDQSLLMNLHGISTTAQVEIQGEKGRATAQLTASQDNLKLNQNAQGMGAEWERYSADLQGQANQAGTQLNLHGTAQGGAGFLTQTDSEVRSHFGKADGSLEATIQEADGSNSSLQTQGGFAEISSRRNLQNAKDSELRIQGLHQQGHARLEDKASGQRTEVDAEAEIVSIASTPQEVTFQETRIQGQVSTERDGKDAQGKATQASAKGQAQVEINALTSGGGKVQLDQARLAGSARTTLKREGQQESEMGVTLENGLLSNLKAQKGQVSAAQVSADLSADASTPMQTGKISGQLNLSQIAARDGELSAQGFSLDKITGSLQIKSEKLGQVLTNSPDARRILTTISERWGKEGAPGLFSNDTVTIQLSEGSVRAKAGAANALSSDQELQGHFRLPDLETQLGDAKVDLNLNRLSLSSAEGKTPEVEVTGHASFQPKQPAFNQALQAVVANQLKQLGVGAKVEVELKDGKIQTKIDHFLADGLVNIDLQGENVRLSVDKAKLLGFISAKGLATRIAESQLNNYLLDINREGNSLNLSLNELTDQALHQDNLQIQSLHISPKGSLELDFAYTDTPQYNAQAQARAQEKIEQRLFHDPRTGQARKEGQIEDMVEDLSAPALQKIFSEASAAQLRKILASTGKDADTVIKKGLAGMKDFKTLPIGNRAVMSAYLSRRNGFFDSVDTEERNLMRGLYNGLTPAQRNEFNATLSAEERAQIQKYIADRNQEIRQARANKTSGRH